MNEISHASLLANAEGLVPQAVADYERLLVNYAYSLLKDVEKSRDVVQETFVKLCQQEPDHVRASLKAWLFTVCRNGALDMLRKDRRMISVEPTTIEIMGCESPTPDQSASRKDSHGQALAFLERLPLKQREVIRLRFQSDLSYREISEITQLSESNVGFLLHQGLKQLRALMTA